MKQLMCFSRWPVISPPWLQWQHAIRGCGVFCYWDFDKSGTNLWISANRPLPGKLKANLEVLWCSDSPGPQRLLIRNSHLSNNTVIIVFFGSDIFCVGFFFYHPVSVSLWHRSNVPGSLPQQLTLTLVISSNKEVCRTKQPCSMFLLQI